MRFALSPLSSDLYNVSANHYQVVFSPYHCDLGIILDSKLSFKYHIDMLRNNLARYRGFAWRYLRNINNKSILSTWFNSIIVSKILYGLSIYAAASSSHLASLQQAYSRTINLIGSFNRHLRSLSTDSKSKELNIKKISELIENQDYLQYFLTELIQLSIPARTTRKSDLLFIPYSRLSRLLNTFFIRAPKTYNLYYKNS